MLQKLILCGVAVLTLLTADAQQLRTPAASPTQTIKQDFGISSVELTYSRPSMKGRKIFGDLVPYGKVWRTGANAATRIKFTDDVQIGGSAVKAGEYVRALIEQDQHKNLVDLCYQTIALATIDRTAYARRCASRPSERATAAI